MDIQAIHTALVAIWPDGIPREQYVALAGIFKVCSDLESAIIDDEKSAWKGATGAARRRAKILEKQLHTLEEKIKQEISTPSQGSASPEPRKETHAVPQPPPTRPTTPKIMKSRQRRLFVSEATISQVKGILASGPRTKEDIARQIERGIRAVRYALAALQERGLVKRIPAKAGRPHLYQLA